MNFGELNLGWFDIFLLLVLLFGVIRGRQRGMSEEFLDVLQWILIVVVCGLVYRPMGRFVVTTTPFNTFWSYVGCYLLIAAAIKFFFTYVRHGVGEKLVGSDVFGKMEYYLGSTAGMIRVFCMLLMGLALLNAKQVTADERARMIRLQRENFGEVYFPTLGAIQESIFARSFSGPMIKKYLAYQLIQPIGDERKSGRTVGESREDAINSIIRPAGSL